MQYLKDVRDKYIITGWGDINPKGKKLLVLEIWVTILMMIINGTVLARWVDINIQVDVDFRQAIWTLVSLYWFGNMFLNKLRLKNIIIMVQALAVSSAAVIIYANPLWLFITYNALIGLLKLMVNHKEHYIFDKYIKKDVLVREHHNLMAGMDSVGLLIGSSICYPLTKNVDVIIMVKTATILVTSMTLVHTYLQLKIMKSR